LSINVAAATITVGPLIAAPASVDTCTPVTFTAPTSENCTVSSYNYVWTFGDNSSSVTTTLPISPAHTYSLPGNYTCRCHGQ
jgi:PKD repeat protein